MLLFATLHPFVSCLSNIVRSSYRLLHSSPSLIPDIAAFALASPSSFSSCVVLSFLRFLSANHTSLVPSFTVYPHRRLPFILRPPLSTVSSLRRTRIIDAISTLPLSSFPSSNIEESNQAAFVVSGLPVSHDTYLSLFRYRYGAAFVVETRVRHTVGIVAHDGIAVSHRKRHAAGFGGAANATRRRPLPAASSSPLSASSKRSLYRRHPTITSSLVSAKLHNTSENVWPVASQHIVAGSLVVISPHTYRTLIRIAADAYNAFYTRLLATRI